MDFKTILPIKEQYALKDKCLKERLDIVIPHVMASSQADAWIVASKEYHEDLVFDLLTPASYLNARRVTMLVFIKHEGKILNFSLSLPDADLETYYTRYWQFGKEEQMAALNRLLTTYQPQRIAINISKDYTFADGLSYGLYALLQEQLQPEFKERLYCDDLLPIKVMEIRTPTELKLLEEVVVPMAFDIIEDTFSLKTITPGVTTTEDLEFHMMDLVSQRGLNYWFSPTIDKQNLETGMARGNGVIEKGDLLHCDFGIKYLNVCTDTQRLAYICKDDETSMPEWILNGMAINNRFQDIVREAMIPEKTGNEVLAAALEKGKAEGIVPCLYSHPCNVYGHGPGPIIGLWNNQNSIPFLGELPLSYNTTYALELNTQYTYNHKTYAFFTEETVALVEEGVRFLYPNRDKVYLLK